MDTIQTVNTYLENYVKETGSVVVKQVKTTNKKTFKEQLISYVVTPISQKEKEYIDEHKTLPEDVLDYLIYRKHLSCEDDIAAVLLNGEIARFNNPDSLVYQFPKRRVDIRENKDDIYRNYIISRKEQVALIGSVNPCKTAQESWNSVCMKVGSKYGLILKIVI